MVQKKKGASLLFVPKTGSRVQARLLVRVVVYNYAVPGYIDR